MRSFIAACGAVSLLAFSASAQVVLAEKRAGAAPRLVLPRPGFGAMGDHVLQPARALARPGSRAGKL
jgi:hypothetical protein